MVKCVEQRYEILTPISIEMLKMIERDGSLTMIVMGSAVLLITLSGMK